MEDKRKHPTLQSCLAFSITTRCNFRCKHCIVSSDSGGVDMAWDDLRCWIEEAAKIDRVKEICMTGGEPFIVYDLLQKAVAYAASLGLKVTAVTNSYWASSFDRAVQTLEGVSSLSRLGFSIDQFHLEFVSVDRIKNAILAARQVGIEPAVQAACLADTEGEKAELEQLLGDIPDLTIQTQPVLRTGRAASELVDEQFASRDYDILCTLASTSNIEPDGRVHACCGPTFNLKFDNPLWLGNAKEDSLTSVLDNSQHNTALQIIRTRGPYHLWSLVRGGNGNLPQYDTTNICTLCLAMMSDPEFLRDMELVLQSSKLHRKTAVDCFFSFQEPAMLLNL